MKTYELHERPSREAMAKLNKKMKINMGMLIVLFTIVACFVSSWLFIVWEDACTRGKNIANELNIG